jgi:hypothetical protein
MTFPFAPSLYLCAELKPETFATTSRYVKETSFMSKSAALSLLGTALLLASCSSEPKESQQQDASGPANTARGDAPPLSESRSSGGRGAAEVAGLPTDHMPSPDDQEDASRSNGVLPLQRGVYVLQNSGCTAPSNAAVRFYDGRGISGSATHACRMLIGSRRGDSYVVEQSCIDTPTGDGPRTSEPQTITVHDALTFTMETTDESSRFRYCPTGELPGYLRERMTQLRGNDSGVR